MKDKLPKGITERNGKFRVSIMVDGARKTGTKDTLKEAVDLAEDIRNGIVEEEKVSLRWNLDEAREHYVDEHLIPGDYSASSIRQYESRIKSFIRFLGEDKVLDEITTADIYGYVSSMKKQRKLASGTLKNDIVMLGAVMRHARKVGGMTADIPEMPLIKKKKAPVRFLTHDQEQAVVSYLEHIGSDFLKDLFIVLLDTGLRIDCECLSLEAANINLRSRKIFIWKSKSTEPRVVPITDRVAAILKRRILAAPSDKRPFAEHSYQKVLKLWEPVRAHMGWSGDRKYTLHICRHTFCTRLVSGGVDLRTVQKLAGHEDISTTMNYSHFVPDNMYRALDALQPPKEDEGHLRVVEARN